MTEPAKFWAAPELHTLRTTASAESGQDTTYAEDNTQLSAPSGGE